MSTTTHYQLLGVQPHASTAEIKHRYRELSMEYHPDKGGDHEKMARINEAYRVLSNASLRRKYDEGLTPRLQPKAATKPYDHHHAAAMHHASTYHSRHRRDFKRPKKTPEYWVWLSTTDHQK